MTNDTKSVERFGIVGHEWGMEWHRGGEYVKYTDYATLAAENEALKARVAELEAQSDRYTEGFNAGIEAAAERILKTQLGFDEKGNDWIKGNNSAVIGCAAAIRALQEDV